MNILVTVLHLSAVFVARGDIYFHNPRGSNNRLNERSAQRTNANRVFDSQNNNRGGYNVGDRLSTSATTESNQYQMTYFQSSSKLGTGDLGVSLLRVEWTNQHGCGGNEDNNPHKLNCQLVLQYMCRPELKSSDNLRDGTTTKTQDYQKPGNREDLTSFNKRKNRNVKPDRAYVEPFEFYDKCQVRERNKGLFTADQNLKGNSAKYTRQNPNGNRYGYECPEERDYYPYWHPTDWKDIGIFAENTSMCSYYKTHSFNVQSKWECVEKWTNGQPKHYSQYNNNDSCVNNNGEWLEFHNYLEKATNLKTQDACAKKDRTAKQNYIWARPIYEYSKQCLIALEAPFCSEAPFTRDNHLGNGVDLEPLSMIWKLPYFPSGQTRRCMLRMRYNISTDDYDPYNTNATFNAKDRLPIQQNPAIDVGVQNIPVRLAINTAQYGRVFQDRSHVFLLKPRPSGGAAGNLDYDVIHNLNVRGKRGNIVQVYPAVEYDFFPTNMEIRETDLVHIQWTGSNSHNNGNPAGDGQAGDDGEGTSGTDRNNLVGLGNRLDNFPLDMENEQNLFKNVKSVKWVASSGIDVRKLKGEDISVQFASAGYYRCVAQETCGNESLEKKATVLDKLLNNAPASFGGMLLRFQKGKYHYMCTRNNNFTNRSQKGTLIVR